MIDLFSPFNANYKFMKLFTLHTFTQQVFIHRLHCSFGLK